MMDENPLVEHIGGDRLQVVERLAWSNTEWDPAVGPTKLHFRSGRALVVDGRTDWTLKIACSVTADDSWLGPYDYEIEGERWVLRDATHESPFEGLVGSQVRDVEFKTNEVGEVVGVVIEFDSGALRLSLWEGEVTTHA